MRSSLSCLRWMPHRSGKPEPVARRSSVGTWRTRWASGARTSTGAGPEIHVLLTSLLREWRAPYLAKATDTVFRFGDGPSIKLPHVQRGAWSCATPTPISPALPGAFRQRRRKVLESLRKTDLSPSAVDAPPSGLLQSLSAPGSTHRPEHQRHEVTMAPSPRSTSARIHTVVIAARCRCRRR